MLQKLSGHNSTKSRTAKCSGVNLPPNVFVNGIMYESYARTGSCTGSDTLSTTGSDDGRVRMIRLLFWSSARPTSQETGQCLRGACLGACGAHFTVGSPRMQSANTHESPYPMMNDISRMYGTLRRSQHLAELLVLASEHVDRAQRLHPLLLLQANERHDTHKNTVELT